MESQPRECYSVRRENYFWKRNLQGLLHMALTQETQAVGSIAGNRSIPVSKSPASDKLMFVCTGRWKNFPFHSVHLHLFHFILRFNLHTIEIPPTLVFISPNFDKRVQWCNHHRNQDIERFCQLPQIPWYPFEADPFPHPLPLATTDVFSEFCLPRTSREWNHAVGSLLSLTPFTQHNVYVISMLLLVSGVHCQVIFPCKEGLYPLFIHPLGEGHVDCFPCGGHY